MVAHRHSVRVMAALVALIIVNLLALCMQVYRYLPNVHVRVIEPLPSSSMVISTRMQNQISSSTNEAEADAFHHPSNSSSTKATTKSTYVRYDLLTTMLERDNNVRSVAHQLPSIPSRRRMIAGTDGVPADAVWNLTYFLESRLRPNEEDRPLYVYNPMLVPLNRKYIDDTIIDDLGLLFDYEEYERPPAYIAVYRVSNFGNCHGPGRGVPESIRNYLGLALLDKDLSIVRTTMEDRRYTDVVIDLNKQLFKANWTPRGKLVEKQFFQDCQLVVAPLPLSPVNAKADRLMLICNEYITHVRLERTGTFKWASRVHTDKSVKIRFENTYGNTLQLTALEMPNVIMRQGARHGDKNLHFFRQVVTCGGEDVLGDGYLEIWPGGPHETRYMDFSNYKYDITTKSTVNEPVASFMTIDDVGISPLISRDSGSACCISIRWHDDNDEDGEGRRLLLGFSHRKTRKGRFSHRKTRKGLLDSPKYNYVSRVYAFEPIPPFDIVARSGFFCLGFELGLQSNGEYQEKSEDITNEQVIGAANDYRLKINGEVFDKCPSIHFVTGIADKLDEEEETAIISYGVNDCYPRMIEVPKKVLVGLLKGSPEVEANKP
jgi:hypothetical protein